jgi:hypothetical protein
MNGNRSNMSHRLAKFSQSAAARIFKAAANAGVKVRVEFRADGTIIATSERLPEGSLDGALGTETSEDLRKLI